MNTTVASLTVSTLLGKRRALLLFVLPALLLALAVLVRATVGHDNGLTKAVLGSFGMSPLVPLLGLIIGTGVIGAEIDDGSIVYLLSKPLPRWMIVVTKLLVAVGCIAVFVAIPMLASGLMISGLSEGLAAGYFWGALAGGTAYSALFLWLAVVSRHAVIIGLIYALVWESLVGMYVPGARTLSIQQWALSVAGEVAVEGEVESAVSFGVGAVLLAVVIIGATTLACV
ncbi:MAG TPA: ABC transporter permease subunit, partial [Actinopolymorphaceae bacterium]